MSSGDVDMSLDQIAKRDGVKGRNGRGGRRQRRGGDKKPVTATPQRRKSVEHHNERAQKHRNERNSRRLFSDKKPQYVPVVFGNTGAPEKVLTGRLTESNIPKQQKQQQPQQQKQPVSLVQAALERGREVFLKSKAARGRGKEQGGKRASLPPREQRKRPVIQPPLSRKLHIVRPGEPGYQRQLRRLRDRTLSVRLVSKSEQKSKSQQSKRISQKASNNRSSAAPAQRLMGPQSRRIALGMSNSSNSSAEGPLSNRFASLHQK